MKTAVSALTLITLMTLSIICIQSADAQNHNGITINADGNITPSTATVYQTGDVYFLNENITQSVWIYKSNIVFDGNGCAISGGTLYILDVHNITVRNLTITDSHQGITVTDCSNVIITNNTIRETGASLPFSQTWAITLQRGNSNQIIENNFIANMVGIAFAETFDNLIRGNNITDSSNIALGFYNSSENRIYNNNFINNSLQFYDWGIGLYPYMASRNTWDNGSISGGNYWSDYQTKYPNASRINDLETGDTAYYIDAQDKDNYPLMEPFHTVPPAEASPTPPAPQDNAIGNLTVLGISAAAIAAVIAGLAVYLKKRHL
jgi:parallel beta-helix repeat protein